MPTNPLICIVGPTACGKTALAVRLAQLLHGEILSADSRQVYRNMDIGTGKDLKEYTINGTPIPYHLIDLVDAGYRYSVFEYCRDFKAAYQTIINRQKMPILCGGSGLYIEAVLKGYRMEEVPVDKSFRDSLEQKNTAELIQMLAQLKPLHNTSDTSSTQRLIRALEIETYYAKKPQMETPTYNYQLFHLLIDRSLLRERIAKRLDLRLQEGMIEEVEKLLNKGLSIEDLKYYGLEYKFIAQYLNHEMSFVAMKEQLNIAIGQFAKRQQTWFNRMRKHGFQLIDIDGNLSTQEQVGLILDFLKAS